MRKYGLWILTFALVCVAAISLVSFHQQRRQQLIDYLLAIDKSFAEFDTIEELNLEASKADNEGNQAQEQQLLKRSLELSTVLIEEVQHIQPGPHFIQRLQENLLQWSTSNQRLLEYRAKVVDTIKDNQADLATTNQNVNKYLQITEENQNLRSKFHGLLHKYAHWYFIDLSKYLTHVL